MEIEAHRRRGRPKLGRGTVERWYVRKRFERRADERQSRIETNSEEKRPHREMEETKDDDDEEEKEIRWGGKEK